MMSVTTVGPQSGIALPPAHNSVQRFEREALSATQPPANFYRCWRKICFLQERQDGQQGYIFSNLMQTVLERSWSLLSSNSGSLVSAGPANPNAPGLAPSDFGGNQTAAHNASMPAPASSNFDVKPLYLAMGATIPIAYAGYRLYDYYTRRSPEPAPTPVESLPLNVLPPIPV